MLKPVPSTLYLYLDTASNPFAVASLFGPNSVALAHVLQVEYEPPSENAGEAASDAYMEVQSGTMRGGSTQFSFKGEFTEPPIVPTSEGGNPATIRIKDVTMKGFTAMVVELRGNDRPHLPMNVRAPLPGHALHRASHLTESPLRFPHTHTPPQAAYAAASPGIHKLPDGRVVEGGRKKTRL